jgi:hypothetical protein
MTPENTVQIGALGPPVIPWLSAVAQRTLSAEDGLAGVSVSTKDWCSAHKSDQYTYRSYRSHIVPLAEKSIALSYGAILARRPQAR